jgi:hypothetical protein
MKLTARVMTIGLVFVFGAVVAIAQDAPSFDKARDAFRSVLRKGDLDQKAAAAEALVAAADARGSEELLGALRAAEDRVEKLRADVEKTGRALRDAWKVVDEQNTKGRPVSQGTADPAIKKDREIKDKLAALAFELKETEASAAYFRTACGRLIGALPPAERTTEIARLSGLADKARTTADRLVVVRVFAEVDAPEARDALVELLARGTDPDLRAAAIDALVFRADGAAAAAVAKALEDEAWPVRAAAARALAALPTLDGVPALIEALEKAEGRTLDEVVAALEDVAGKSKHDNATLWKEWWTAEGEKLKGIMADLGSDDAATRRKGYAATVAAGFLGGVRRMMLLEGLVPERDVLGTAPRGKAPTIVAEDSAAKEAREAEEFERRSAIGQTLSSRPKTIRERAIAKWLVAPFRRAAFELDDYDVAAGYARAMRAVRSADVRTALDDAAKSYPPRGEESASPERLLAVKAKQAAHDRMTAAARDAKSALDPNRAGPAAGGPTPGSAEGPDDEIDPRTGKPRPSTKFYGIETFSKRVLYVLDVSGSMRFVQLSDAERERLKVGGKLPIDVAKDELAQSIKSLPDDATFNIVFFNHDVASYKDKPVKADKAGKADALKWIEARGAEGATNLFDAVERGFLIAGRGTHDKHYGVSIDTIYLLSDGRANRGRLTESNQILDEVRRLNSEKKLKIHCIGIGKDHDEPLMKALAALTGGQYVAR